MRKIFYALFVTILTIIIVALPSTFAICNHTKPSPATRNRDQIDIKRHVMTIEETDADGTLYRIDITSPEELEERPYIDYNIKVKLQTVSLRNLDKDTIIDMIREECPETITGITVRF